MNSANLAAGQIQAFLTGQTVSSLLRALLWLVAGVPASVLLSRYVRRRLLLKYTQHQALLASRTVLYLSLGFVFVSVLDELGFKLSHLLGAAGIIGVAVGFASQTSISNVISGLFLIAERSFEVDDVVSVNGITGQVLSIDMLSVKIRTFDNKFVRIPNETIIKSELTNITRFPIRRLEIDVGVAYKEDIGRVRDVLLEVAQNEPLCLNEPEPMVVIKGFGSSSIDLQLLVWATKADYLTVKNALTEAIKRRFDEQGIEIPFPHVSLCAGSATEPIPIRMVS